MTERLIAYLKAAVFFITSLTLSILLVIGSSPAVFACLIKPLKLPTITGLSFFKIMNNYLIMLNYLVNPLIKRLSFPNFSQSLGGISHFHEVKNLFLLNNLVLLGGLVLSIYLIQQTNNKKRWFTLKRPIQFFSILPLLFAGLLIFFDFNQLFVTFHQIFFHNANWIFDPNQDPVITILPEEFFQIEFIIFAIVFLIILFGFNWFVYRRTKKELLLDNSVDVSITR